MHERLDSGRFIDAGAGPSIALDVPYSPSSNQLLNAGIQVFNAVNHQEWRVRACRGLSNFREARTEAC